MKKIIINGTTYYGEDGAYLKDTLIQYGMAFPCGGKGQCGKCRIRCNEIEPTDKDRRFLTENAIKEGWRIACDKITGDYSVECPPPARPDKVRELSSCNIIASIGVKTVTIGIADDEIAEEVTIPNPLYDGNGVVGIAENYEINGRTSTKQLRAALAKESIELFEKYNKAKAETFVIAGSGLFLRILTGLNLEGAEPDYNTIKDDHCFDLPTETTYFLPTVNAYIGGDILCETVSFGEETLALDCGEVFNALYINKDNTTAASMWDLTYDELGIKAVRATIKTLTKGEKPMVKVFGEYAEKIEEALLEEGFEYVVHKKELTSVGKATGSLRFRAKLNKEKSRISTLNVLNSEEFHKYFAE